MTARPAAQELTEAEQRFLDRPDAPEALRERMADTLWATALATVHMAVDGGPEASAAEREKIRRQRYLRLADAALAVVRGER